MGDAARAGEEDLIEKYKKGVFGALPEPDLLKVLIEEEGRK